MRFYCYREVDFTKVISRQVEISSAKISKLFLKLLHLLPAMSAQHCCYYTHCFSVNILTGLGVDYSFTSRFKLNIGVRTSISSSPDVPILFFGVIGSKINL